MGLSGVPLPYPPYLTNPNLAALISRGLLPTDVDLLNNAVKEQMSGLDLSMTSLKREPGDFDEDDDDVDSNAGSEDSNLSSSSLLKNEPKEVQVSRSSRRKPAAPQWVNPDWQDPEKKPAEDEVIINGVCVMQTPEDYGRRSAEETVRVEPTPVGDGRFDADEDDRSDASSISNGAVGEDLDDKEDKNNDDEEGAIRSEEQDNEQIKQETEDERWDY